MRQCSLKWVPSSMVEVSDLWCCEAQSLRNNLPFLSTCKVSILYGFTSAKSPLRIFANTRKSLSHGQEAQITEFIRLKRLNSKDSEEMCWFFANTAKQRAQEINQKNITRIATKRRRTRESHSRLMLHSQLYTSLSINLKTSTPCLCRVHWVLRGSI